LGADRQDRFGDPFDTDSGDLSFFDWIQGPEPGRDVPGDGPFLSRFLAHLHAERDDLRGGFPDLDGPGFANFSSWLMAAGRHELRLDDAFVEPVSRGGAPRVGLGRRIKNRLRRAYHSPLGQRAKSAAVGALGPARTEALKRRLRPRPQAPPKEPPQRGPDVRRPGVNLVGYLRAETGMGEAGRSLARAFESAGVPLSLHSLDLGVVARQDDATYGDAVSDFPYDINLFVVNADQVPPVLDHLGPEVWAGRYNIGLWLWELEDFPPHLHPSFEHLHEIWTPSSFCVDAIGGVAPIPVRRVPLPIVPRTPSSDPTGDVEWRRRLGLPEDAFLFLYIFNYLSYFERKNPLAAVRAFRNAFGDDPSKLLVLKTSQSDFAPDDHRRLLAEIDGAANVVLLEDYLSRDDLDGLMSTCDAYVSPHRSEGFGLTLAEAMAAGKAVLAAPWSGNADFFGINNGYPVRYSLVTLEQDAGPYPAGSRWADIDIGHLAERMAHVVSDGDGRRRLGRRARADIEAELGPEAVGRRLARRFDDIVRRQSRSLRPPLPPSAR
ncbi:MAG: glycosyltransferase, partial [Acidobacteriota bacterium]